MLAICVCIALVGARPQAQDPAASAPLAPGDVHRWMDELFQRKPGALKQPLARFIFPGSHDTGTYNLRGDAACDGCQSTELLRNPVEECLEKVPAGLESFCDLTREVIAQYTKDFATAQALTVGDQLNAGARFLDLRFFRATADDQTRTEGRLQEGRFYAHHGLAGPDSAVILSDIAAFLNSPGNEREIVILAFSQMMEGESALDARKADDFFDVLRQIIPGKMARKQVSACADDPTCTPTERFGAAATLGEFLGQGSQVIVTCSCTEAPDIWAPMGGATPYMVSSLDSNAPEGYPPADSVYRPWRNDGELFRLSNDLSALRDSKSQEDLFQLGYEIGLDMEGLGMYRWVVCDLAENYASVEMCGAVNDDWDELRGLADNAGWVNPKGIPAIVGLRRDRVNVVSADHFSSAITEEVFTLNLGATRVFHRIEKVEPNDDRWDDGVSPGSAPDFYPVFFYPGTRPTLYSGRVQRYNQMQNTSSFPDGWHGWPSWRAYPNATETASVWLSILDADSGSDDDVAAIVENADASKRGVLEDLIPIKACVENAGGCVSRAQQSTDGGDGSDSVKLSFSRSACVWSWVPGDAGIDPRSICTEETPEMRIYGTRLPEGNDGPSSFEFVVTLSKPSIYTVTAAVTAAPGTAESGTDFTLTQDTITFQPGETRQVVKVYVHGETTPEADETFSVTLGSPKSAEIATAYATGTIVNDDVPAARVEGVSDVEGHSGWREFGFTFRLNGPAPMPVTLRYRTVDGSAEAGSDYVAVPDGVVSIATGQSSATAVVRVIGDYRIEADETFAVVLESAAGATIADSGQATGVIVNDDVAASVTAPGPQTGFEGNDDTFALGVLTDARPAGPWTVMVKWGDATADTYTVAASGALSRVHTYADNGSYTVTVSVKDVDGVGSTPVTFTATIANLAPKATLASSGPVAEGSQATISFSSQSDPSAPDTTAGFRYAYSCSNASLASATYATGATAASTMCAFDDNGAHTVRARIIDKDDGFNEYTTVVTVANVAPAVTAAGSVISEGNTATISGTISDPGVHDTFDVTVTWGDGTSSQFALPAGSTTYAASHPYLDDNPTATASDIAPVVVTVTDKDGGAGNGATGVTVNNASPVIGSPVLTDGTGAPVGAGALPALVGLPVDLEAAFADIGALDTHGATIDWGDGATGPGSVTESSGIGTARATHTWSAIGDLTVTISVTDDDTGTGTRQTTVAVVDATGAVCTLARELTPMLGSAGLPPDTTKALRQLLGEIDGNIDGQAANGACDMFAKQNWVAALVKLEQAVGTIEAMIAGGSLTAAQTTTLRQVQARLTLAATSTYVTLAPAATNAEKLATASGLARSADVATAARDYVEAIGFWLAAVRLLAPMS